MVVVGRHLHHEVRCQVLKFYHLYLKPGTILSYSSTSTRVIMTDTTAPHHHHHYLRHCHHHHSGKYDLAQELTKRTLTYNKSSSKAWEYSGLIHEKECSYVPTPVPCAVVCHAPFTLPALAVPSKIAGHSSVLDANHPAITLVGAAGDGRAWNALPPVGVLLYTSLSYIYAPPPSKPTPTSTDTKLTLGTN